MYLLKISIVSRSSPTLPISIHLFGKCLSDESTLESQDICKAAESTVLKVSELQLFKKLTAQDFLLALHPISI